jgi:hypothetical protein
VASSFQATAYNGTPHAPGPDGTPRSAKEHGGSFQTPDRTGIALLMMRPGRGPDRRKCKCCLKLFRSLIAATNASAFFPLCIVPCLALSLRLPNPQLLDYQNAQMAAYLSSLRKHP